mgnify:CR=1 FL=1
MDKAYQRFVKTTPNPSATKNSSGDCELPPLSGGSVGEGVVDAAVEVADVAAASAAVGGAAARARTPTVSRRTACRREASTAIVAAVGRGATHMPDAATGEAVGVVCGCRCRRRRRRSGCDG